MELHAPERPSATMPPPRKPKRRKSIMLRLFGIIFTAGVFLFLAGSAGTAYYLWLISRDLPSFEKLESYEPPVTTRIHAGDGELISEFAHQKRIFLPINAIPEKVRNAFVAAEDKHFYEHGGLDFQGLTRAMLMNLENKLTGRNRRLIGASTITQQVAKNMLLTSEQSFERKVKEAILSVRIERAFDKGRILELYLNEIYLGKGAYGVGAASLIYFGKELSELKLEEIAYLALLPKAPNNYDPAKNYEKAFERRNYVLTRMAEDGYITRAEEKAALAKQIVLSPRPINSSVTDDYFAEDTRRALLEIFGEEKLYTAGYSVRTTLDPQLQKMARVALREGLLRYDRNKGFRGPLVFEINGTKVDRIDPAGNWSAKLAEIPLCGPSNPIPNNGPVPRCVYSDLEPWRLGVVLEVTKDQAVVGLQPIRSETVTPPKVVVPYAEMKWARTGRTDKPKNPKDAGGGASEIVSPGQLIYVAPQSELSTDETAAEKKPGTPQVPVDPARNWRLVQIPKIEGAIAVMDPHTGRVLALVGGFSYASSQFDRAMQAKRQPGSSFKPLIYAAAMDNGYNPSTIMVDAPIAIDQGGGKGVWVVRNYDNKFGGPSSLRVGIEKSRNAMTVRLAQDIGMPMVVEYSRRFGAYDDLLPVFSMSLGAGETTLVRMTAAYCAFANGGKQVGYTLIDRIQDRYGKVVWNYDKRKCPGCAAQRWEGQDEPQLDDIREQILDPITAYQMTSMLQGVVDRGTGYLISKVGKPLAGKTGTSNDEKDAWFVGFSPDLAAGVFVGFDTPTAMGKGETGGHVAAPIFRDFMKLALADKPAAPFRQPPDVKLVMVNSKTGARAMPGEPGAIWEAFKPNEDPPEPSEIASYPGMMPGETPQAGYPAPAPSPYPSSVASPSPEPSYQRPAPSYPPRQPQTAGPQAGGLY